MPPLATPSVRLGVVPSNIAHVLPPMHLPVVVSPNMMPTKISPPTPAVGHAADVGTSLTDTVLKYHLSSVSHFLRETLIHGLPDDKHQLHTVPQKCLEDSRGCEITVVPHSAPLSPGDFVRIRDVLMVFFDMDPESWTIQEPEEDQASSTIVPVAPDNNQQLQNLRSERQKDIKTYKHELDFSSAPFSPDDFIQVGDVGILFPDVYRFNPSGAMLQKRGREPNFPHSLPPLTTEIHSVHDLKMDEIGGQYWSRVFRKGAAAAWWNQVHGYDKWTTATFERNAESWEIMEEEPDVMKWQWAPPATNLYNEWNTENGRLLKHRLPQFKPVGNKNDDYSIAYDTSMPLFNIAAHYDKYGRPIDDHGRRIDRIGVWGWKDSKGTGLGPGDPPEDFPDWK